MRKRILALDFDGVIADNTKEFVILALKSYKSMGGKIKNPERAASILKSNRPYLRTAKDFYSMLQLSESGKKVDVKNIKKTSAAFRNQRKEFERRYFESRKMMMKDRKKWFRLYRVFGGVTKSLKYLSKDFELFIATTRDLNSAYYIIRKLGIPIKRRNVASKEISTNKISLIKHVCRIGGCKPSDIFFLDDSVENLKEVRKIGTRTALASWGFVLPEHIREAKRIGIPVIKQNGLGKRIRKLL